MANQQLRDWKAEGKDVDAELKVPYVDFCKRWTWSKNSWAVRKKCKDVKIGRLYMVSPREGERFYLRSLLAVRTDCVSWSELMQTPTGDQCDTFKAAALAWGLLEDDKEWVKCLEEAVLVRGGSQLRQLFVLLLTERLLVDPHAAYETFKDSLSDDFVHAGMAADDAEILLRLDVEFRLRTFNPAATLKGVVLLTTLIASVFCAWLLRSLPGSPGWAAKIVSVDYFLILPSCLRSVPTRKELRMTCDCVWSMMTND